jgi:hypothetical protein
MNYNLMVYRLTTLYQGDQLSQACCPDTSLRKNLDTGTGWLIGAESISSYDFGNVVFSRIPIPVSFLL